ncbi:MAG: flagellar hook-length control protein FliK [Sulfuricurvum sp.]|uniref:flagellar hook-length control protein FliK n=1 Tax=Sulfuricurvum sp. TaxID=2025608 RepID=UPI0026068E66|nr:flagellar hook-length control protein FliK [Sulfuricurvum sp.]MDD5119471.1 flagellar hook-length control protein FliK [Sulfuricurvum sp.]
MINQSKEAGTKPSLIDLLGGNTKSSTTKSSDLFSKLLATLSTTQQHSGDFKAIIDPKSTSAKTVVTNNTTHTKSSPIKELQSLLLGGEEKDSALFSKELINTLSNDQVRTLIQSAKEYLKNAITAKSPEYQNDTKSLPKTLMGLVQLADKMGLNPQSISLSTIMNDSTEKKTFATELKTFSPEVLTKPLFEAKALTQLTSMPAESSSFVSITQLINDAKTKEQKATGTPVSESSPTAKLSAPTDTSLAAEFSTQATTTASTKTSPEKLETQPLKALLQHLDKREKVSDNVTLGNALKVSDVKAPDVKISETKTPETKVSALTTSKTDTLVALLQGENESKESKTDRNNASKTDGETPKVMTAPKADSLEVKSKEASQSMRSFASDLKDAVQEYKPPFTRLTMKLNPEKLGEVEVTLVQRGNNVHVNIQSNNTNSVAFLAHNAMELKTQLANQGITNTTMNFMSSGDGQAQNQQQQHNQQQQQNRFRAYESLKDMELKGEQLSALEIIIPHYA